MGVLSITLSHFLGSEAVWSMHLIKEALVEIVSALKFDKDFEIKLVVLGCFSIGHGAALTPVGEPLSTIAIAKLKGAIIEPAVKESFFSKGLSGL